MALEDMCADERAAVVARAAMRAKILDALADPTDEHVAWVRTLCEELRDRLKRLTPNRQDLHDALDASYDVDLLVQMFRHGAIDLDDSAGVVVVVFDRLARCCAPVQDEAVAHARRHILAIDDVAKRLAVLLEIAHQILDDIFRMVDELVREEPARA